MPDMFFRNFEPETHAAIKAGARARGITIAEYIARLVALHEAVRTAADNGNATMQRGLEKLGLETRRG